MEKAPRRSKRAGRKKASKAPVHNTVVEASPGIGPASDPAFELDNWARGTDARKGLGLGKDDFANRLDESLPTRQFTGRERLPTFGGTVKSGR